MINYIVGQVVEKETNKIILDKDGFAFDIYFPTSSMYSVNDGDNVKIYIHMVMNDDGISLYGFLTKEDKQMFELLLIVNRLGPKGAMNIISNLGSSRIKNAIVKKDAKAFSAISGIGQKVADKIIIAKKTAEQLVTKVELTDDMKADELIKLALKK